jgi:hypothetical protein
VEPVPRIADPLVRRDRKDDAHKLTAVGGLDALSLDALSSVAYGPEAIVIALVAVGAAATPCYSPKSNPANAATNYCTTTVASSSPPRSAHAPTSSSPSACTDPVERSSGPEQGLVGIATSWHPPVDQCGG